jgi:hypothetical protein
MDSLSKDQFYSLALLKHASVLRVGFIYIDGLISGGNGEPHN